jgi:hypothetical protein
MKTYAHFFNFLEWEMSFKTLYIKSKHIFYVQKIMLSRALLKIMWENMVKPDGLHVTS